MSTYSNAFMRTAAHMFIAAAVLCLPSCTSERTAAPTRPGPEQAASTAPVSPTAGDGTTALKIEPRTADRRTTLVVTADGSVPNNVLITWQVNGATESSAEAGRFDCAGTRRGDAVRAVAVVNGREVRSNEVTVGNTPPELSDVVLQPVMTALGESLAVTAVASDADDDKTTIQYAWTVNGMLAGNGDTLNRALKRNDAVRVEVLAYDGQSSSVRIVLNNTIANHPPVFHEHQDFTFSGGNVTYHARANDADGDQVSFSLASPVEGMSIDRLSGTLTWKVPDGFRGEQPAMIVADDGHLGTAQYTVTFSIRE